MFWNSHTQNHCFQSHGETYQRKLWRIYLRKFNHYLEKIFKKYFFFNLWEKVTKVVSLEDFVVRSSFSFLNKLSFFAIIFSFSFSFDIVYHSDEEKVKLIIFKHNKSDLSVLRLIKFRCIK